MPERGFTLLEIMLVIFLIGLASAGVVQTFATDSESPAKKAAQVTVPKQVQMLLQPGSDIWQKEYALELQRRRLTLHDIELELQKEAKKKTPQIRFSPFEPATPFTLRFYSAAQNACWAVKLAHDGALSLNQCDERMP
ncbi:prepilin-type N-terminal cleavage/methylation domain-containing protein [Escherichia coli]|nr:prepilin-type N-terminal cleavage/methylation domain-containing protein [Escherichia coli]EGV9162211.1 prepilin-type N-terminal cleavage/methylation domain-containing protein [Escherichia coli]